MAVAVSPVTEARTLSRPERKLAWLLRFFALLFAIGTVGFLLRPDDTVKDLDWVGGLVGLPTLARSAVPMVSDFWLALAIANMATITACCWLGGADIRHPPAPLYPGIRSQVASSPTGV